MIHASLFSGIGGPEVAAAMLGWENAFHCEINPFGKAVLEYWFPNSTSYDDITKTDFKEWRGRVDVLTAGIPCQPFSYAGKRGGADDERYLWPEAIRVINEIRPTWVIIENVAGIVTMVEGGILTDLGCDSSLFDEDNDLHRYEHQGTFTVERICHEFEECGYAVQPVLIPAAAVEAPHRRDRVFIVAYYTNTEGVQRDGCCAGYEGEPGGRPMSESGDGRGTDDAADPASGRGGTLPASVHARLADGDGIIGDGCKWDATHTNGERREEPVIPGRETHPAEDGARVDDRTERFGSDLFPENRWASFPTVSSVHRGNDGLPFPLDDLAIPATKWRTESLKAYGNAIVPQVMYRIFQAIEQCSEKI